MRISRILLGVLVVPVSIACVEEDPRIHETRMGLIEIQGALSNFYKDTGRYPSAEESLDILVSNQDIGGWAGPYLSRIKLNDAWQNLYFYGEVRHMIFIASAGPNGSPETRQSDLQQGLSRGDDVVILMAKDSGDDSRGAIGTTEVDDL